MDIGIGIPNSIQGTTGPLLLDWARRADAAGFSSLGSIGALSYPSYEELTVFAAAGAVTERIRFTTNVLLAPARSTAELAKQAATTDQLTGGRLTLGLGIGWRTSDFVLAGRSYDDRGKRFDEQLRDLHVALSGAPIAPDTREAAPPPVQQPIPILVGGGTDKAVQRAAQFGIGWTAGGMAPDDVKPMAEKVQATWKAAGRPGSARITALAYFSVGDVEAASRAYLVDYYTPMGADTAEWIANGALRSPEAIRGAVDAYAAAGVDELILNPTVASLDQVDGLAAIVL